MSLRCAISEVIFIILVLSLFIVMPLSAGGVELNLIYIQPNPNYFGGIGIYISSLNVSNIALLQQPTVYVVDQTGVPRYSYLFSSIPPLLLFLEQSLGVTTYYVFYGGTNPYTSFISTPGSQQSFWLVYDDFDYNTGFWSFINTSIQGGQALVNGGYIALNASYGADVLHIFQLLGRRAFKITFNVSNGWTSTTLTSKEFTDWNSIIDGNDIYFLNPDGTPLYYSILFLDKTIGRLDFAIYLNNSNIVYMMYGGVNPYASYRVQ